MVTLDKLGFDEKSPSETIITTYSEDREPRASTVGVWKKGKNKLFFRLFTENRSFKNLCKVNAGSINIVKDAETIAKCGLPEIFDKADFCFEDSKIVNAPYLSSAEAFVEFEVDNISRKIVSDEIGTSEMAEIVAYVKNVEIMSHEVRPFRRSDFFLIESAIYASRAFESIKKGNRNEFESLVREIKRYKDRCEDIAPKTSEMEIISKILKFLNKEDCLDFEKI